MATDQVLLKSNDLSTLFSDYQGEIRAYIYRFTCNEADVDEIIQDVFIKAYTAIETCQVYENTIRAWLYRIARNHTLNLLERKQNEYKACRKYQVEKDLAYEAGYDDQIIADDIVTHAGAVLSEKEYQVFCLRFLRHFKLAEIAGRLELPLTTVFRLNRAGLSKIKKEFAEIEA